MIKQYHKKYRKSYKTVFYSHWKLNDTRYINFDIFYTRVPFNSVKYLYSFKSTSKTIKL